jgi:hypothetical protein
MSDFHALIEQVDAVKEKLTDGEYKDLVETVAKARTANMFYEIKYTWTTRPSSGAASSGPFTPSASASYGRAPL